MSRGPRLEWIDGGDPTFRVVVEYLDGRTEILPGAELMQSGEAVALYRATWDARRDELAAVHVVNERSGFTRDTISRG